jgi:hypothetical protein
MWFNNRSITVRLVTTALPVATTALRTVITRVAAVQAAGNKDGIDVGSL